MNTTQTTPSTETLSTSRGFGRLAARTTVGKGPKVETLALRKARELVAEVDAGAFFDGFRDERKLMR